MATTATRLLTAREFMEMPPPSDGSKQELVRGEVVTMPPTQQEHGLVQVQIARLLKNFVAADKLGWVGSESGVRLEQGPDTVRGPDVYYYSLARMPERPKGYSDVPPDLAVEILSPSDRRGAVREKVREYVTAGVRLVWVVDPETKTAMVYAGGMRGTEMDEADTITGGDALPGFACRVAEFFE